MTTRRFIDANILLRYLLRDDEEKAERVRDLVERLEHGAEQAVTNHLVVSEVIFTLQKRYRFTKPEIHAVISALLSLRGLRVQEAETIRLALDLFVGSNISYGDAYSATWMRDRSISEIYSYDRKFERVPWVNRFEP